MTQPAQPAPPQQRQRQQTGLSSAQIAAIAALLGTATGAGIAAGLATVTGLPLQAAVALLRLDASERLKALPVLGPAARQVAAAESYYRAAYLANAAARVQARVDKGVMLDDAIAAETATYRQHLAAQTNRAKAAQAVDKAAARHGLVLGWRAVMDSRTSAECRAAHRKNFRITRRPLIGFPGSVHVNCRCRPVAPWANAGWVDETVAIPQKIAATA